VPPAVAETLAPLHKLGRRLLWRGQQRQIRKVSVYSVIDSGRKLLDTPSYNLRVPLRPRISVFTPCIENNKNNSA
jgi:hypothetical protein